MDLDIDSLLNDPISETLGDIVSIGSAGILVLLSIMAVVIVYRLLRLRNYGGCGKWGMNNRY